MFEGFVPSIFILCIFHIPDLKPFGKKNEIKLE